ncbi:Translation initiation factor IF-2, partial [Dissostichus eleginoides]
SLYHSVQKSSQQQDKSSKKRASTPVNSPRVSGSNLGSSLRLSLGRAFPAPPGKRITLPGCGPLNLSTLP